LNRHSLISSSRKYYLKFYRLVVIAVVIMMAVLTGSLLLGDSVRGTLSDRVSERLGSAETVITGGTGFVNEQIMLSPQLSNARGYLLTQGFVSSSGKLLPVYVWGTDADSIGYDEALINEPLASKLEFPNGAPSLRERAGGEALSLHLPAHSLVPSGSLFVTKTYSTQMRVCIKGVKNVKDGGNLLLKNEQTLPLNIFVNRQQLNEVMDMKGKMNMILSDDVLLEEDIAKLWNPTLSGVHLTDTTLTYDGIFISDDIVRSVKPQTTYFSYLVNEIICNTDTVPYSFVTAVDIWKGTPLSGKDIILSDYAASRLHVEVGDSVRMAYFLARDLKNLETKEQKFRVKAIEPMSAFIKDSLLKADFPGLSNVEKCTDWDSDLPIKMDHIHKQDEDFWYKYKNTPKAIVAYDAVVSDWGNSFGTATALRLSPHSNRDSSISEWGSLPTGEGGGIGHSSLFMTVIHPRSQGLYSANNGTDFSSLFMALGFFIILSAILLMQNPLVEMFELRKKELLLYTQIGFTKRSIERLIFRESFSVILFASPFGVLAGVLYSAITLWLLGNVWSGATHTEGFMLHVNILTLFIGWFTGIVICAITLWLVVRNTSNSKVKDDVRDSRKSHKDIVASVLLLAVITAVICNFIWLHSMVVFIICGLLWIVTFGLFLSSFIQKKTMQTESRNMSFRQMIWQSVYDSRKQQMLAYWALSMGVFTVFAVGLNRPDFTDSSLKDKVTGGYDLYIDSRVPIQYDLNNTDVRRKLSLSHLPDSTQFLHFLRHSQDEASCLNLNKVLTPTVLGVDLEDMKSFGLTIKPSDMPSVYIDEEALIWSMMKSVGDTITYKDGNGNDVKVLIAGSYPTGIFHGNAIMSKTDFRKLWPRESGVEVLLVKSSDAVAASELLSTAISEYGLSIQTTNERMLMFFEVTDTYLIIFLTLGGLGLLLGIFCLIIVVRKNLVANLRTIDIYRSIGYSATRIRKILLHENIIIPLFAMFTGAIGAVISISANALGAGFSTILQALLSLLILCAALVWGVKRMIR